MPNAHTPGPWKVSKDMRVFSESTTEWNRTFNAEMPAFIAACGANAANARLIAQAPRMLELLSRLEYESECSAENGKGDKHLATVTRALGHDARAILRAVKGE